MRRSVAFRVLAFVAALLGSLSVPALALTHGLTHDHLAHEHAADAHRAGRSAGPAFDLPSDDGDHAHDHATLDVAPGTRDLARLDLTYAALVAAPAPAAVQQTLVVVRSAARTDRALLARPDPGGGPPPPSRAPPAR